MRAFLPVFLFFVFGLISAAAHAVDSQPETLDDEEGGKKVITPYGPNRVGVTFDNDDVGYMDFRIGLKYPLFYDSVYEFKESHKNIWIMPDELYFSFVGRFGQYIGTRDSSPVIGKQFNPKVFMRYNDLFKQFNDNGKNNFRIDVGLAHESNGQSVSTEEEYLEKQRNVSDVSYADDYISRGWDLLEVEFKYTRKSFENKTEKEQLLSGILDSYLDIKYFFPYGPFQKDAENYYEWEERGDGIKRSKYDGVKLTFKYRWVNTDHLLGFMKNPKVTFVYTTGYNEPLRNNTIRLEFGSYFNLYLAQVPITLWVSQGYNSDLAMYYREVTSWGINIEMATF